MKNLTHFTYNTLNTQFCANHGGPEHTHEVADKTTEKPQASAAKKVEAGKQSLQQQAFMAQSMGVPERLIELISQANQNQDEALKEILAKEPYFYHRIEQIILHTMSEEFERQTAAEREQAEVQLTADLKNYQA